ncbi:alcohol dehydrogenase catalytic domain-containing protein [Paenibacillus sp. CMAA1364]
MQALVYEGPKIMKIRETVVPQIGPGQVLVRVEIVGICGSELSGYLGHNSLRKPPLIMGHEFSGIIELVGEQDSGFKVGDRVTVNPLITCGSCRFCRGGESQLCRSRNLLGAHLPGAFAQYVVVPSANVYALEPHITFEEGALVEPCACAVHVCKLLQLSPSDRVLIYGAGPIGLFALQVAKIHGVHEVVVIDVNEARLEVVRELGGISVTKLDDIDIGDGFDAVIDAVGAMVTRQQSVAAARVGGKVIFTGLHEAQSKLPVNDMIRNEIWAKGAFAYSQADFETALLWIGQGKVRLLPCSETAPLAKGEDCFEKLIAGPGKTVKIFMNPQLEAK